MREIKFRGKRLDNGEWVYGYYFIEERDIEDGIIWRDIPQIQQRYGDHFQYFDVDPATVGQYTGLHDKNGKEIYEGDIVKDSNGRVAYVTFLQQEMGYVLVYHNNDTRLLGHRNTESSYDIDFNIEVIGNIYENPELLKK